MPRGTVKQFDPAQGFGVLRLETGEELPFDVSASNTRNVIAGSVAEVTVGVGLTGRPKAKLVIFELEEDRAPTFAAGIKELKAAGLFADLDAKQVRRFAREVLDNVPARLLRADTAELFAAYYGHGLTERSKREHIYVVDWRFGQETDDIVSDLGAISGVDHLGTLVGLAEDTLILRDRSGLEHLVSVEDGLGALLNLLNRLLAARDEERRFVSLEMDGDVYVIMAGNQNREKHLRKARLL